MHITLLRILSLLDVAKAQSELAEHYEYGNGTKQNINKAIHLYTKAAEGNHAWSQNHLGSLLSNGKYNIPVNYEEAIKWFKKASEQGNLSGDMNLGWVHYYGFGVEQNLNKAFSYYSKSQSIPQAKK